MPRVLAIDYGLRRTGLALSDELRIIANALDTVVSDCFWETLAALFVRFEIDTLVLGYPKDLRNRDTHNTALVDSIHKQLTLLYQDKKIILLDERFTSKMASRTLVMMGVPKKKRQQKEKIDQISALILLQDYLSSSCLSIR